MLLTRSRRQKQKQTRKINLTDNSETNPYKNDIKHPYILCNTQKP